MRKIFFFWTLGLALVVTSCSVVFNRANVTERYGSLVGKKFSVKRIFFVVENSTEDLELIVVPGVRFLPTLEEYQSHGKTSEGVFSDNEIVGLIQKGEIFQIVAFEEVTWPANSLVYMDILREKDGKVYRTCAATGVFSAIGTKGGYYFNDNNISASFEMVKRCP